jgi:hypothetical protein
MCPTPTGADAAEQINPPLDPPEHPLAAAKSPSTGWLKPLVGLSRVLLTILTSSATLNATASNPDPAPVYQVVFTAYRKSFVVVVAAELNTEEVSVYTDP